MESIQQGWRIGALAGERHPRADTHSEPPNGGPGDETALLRAGRAGDRAALDALLKLQERPLLAFCAGILGHAEDAEDAVQETFLRALRFLPTFREQSTFRTWLFRIALNVCLSRRSSRFPTMTWSEAQDSTRSEAPSPEAVALRQLRVREALACLPPRQRAILLLKEREGWSLSEIAAALRWSERRVRYELSRARLALAQWRRDEMDDGGDS